MVNAERKRVVDRGKAVMFLVICGDEVLLQERPLNDKGFAGETIIPSGKNDSGEDHNTAAKREVLEELGLHGKEMTPLGGEFKAITTSPHQYLMRAYLIRISNKEEVKNTEHKEGNFVWESFSEAKRSILWAHSQLVFERAEKLLMEEK